MSRDGAILMVGPDPHANGGIAAAARSLIGSKEFRTYRGDYISSSCTGEGLFEAAGSLSAFIRFCALAVGSRRKLVYIHTSSRTSFLRKSIYALTAKSLGHRVVMHIHPNHFRDYFSALGPMGRRYARHVLGQCQALVALNNGMAEFLKTEVPGVPVHVLPNAIEVVSFSDMPGISRLKGRILYLGAFLRHKGIFDLIDSFAEVKAKCPEANLHFYGDKCVQALTSYAREKGLQDGVSVHGWLGRRAKTAQLKAASLLVLPSHTEGMPLVLLEAMASGTPIIATKVGGVPDLLDDDIATLVPPNDTHALATAIEAVLANPLEAAGKAELAITRARSFDIGVIGRKFSEIIMEQTARYETISLKGVNHEDI